MPIAPYNATEGNFNASPECLASDNFLKMVTPEKPRKKGVLKTMKNHEKKAVLKPMKTYEKNETSLVPVYG